MVLPSFISYLRNEKRYSENTIQAYERDLRFLKEYLIDQYELIDWGQVTSPQLRSWIVSMSEAGQSARSIRRKISSVKHFYRFLKKTKPGHPNPAQALTAPRIGKRLPEVVEARNLQKLWTEPIFNDDFSGKRDRLILTLLYVTGMRRAELLGLTPGDVDLSQHRIKVFGKGAKERWIPLADQMVEEIKAYLEARSDAFQGAGQDALILTDQGKAAYPKYIYNKVHHYLGVISTAGKRSPHVLRHSFATHLSDEGADLQAIRELLGHSSLAATQVYTHNSVEKLKRIYQQAHPKSGSSGNGA